MTPRAPGPQMPLNYTAVLGPQLVAGRLGLPGLTPHEPNPHNVPPGSMYSIHPRVLENPDCPLPTPASTVTPPRTVPSPPEAFVPWYSHCLDFTQLFASFRPRFKSHLLGDLPGPSEGPPVTATTAPVCLSEAVTTMYD